MTKKKILAGALLAGALVPLLAAKEMVDADGIPGRFMTGCRITGRQFEPGTEFDYQIFLPACAEKCGKLALYVMLEARDKDIRCLFSQYMKEGLMPPGLILFVRPGTLPAPAEIPCAASRFMRAEEFDQLGRGFPDFLIAELIPDACARMKVELDPSPDRHFISGGSSGGLACWNAVWYRNDYFRRAFLSSPTFAAIRGGEEPLTLIRKCESRPIRLYVTAGSDEPDYYFGNSLYAALGAQAALEYAGYDFRFELFQGEGHCCRMHEPALLRRMVNFVWANWRTEPVKTLGSQIRIGNLVTHDSVWKQVKADPASPRPVVARGFTYTFEGGRIFAEKDGAKRVAADGFDSISALARSADGWRLCIADRGRRFLYEMAVMPDGSLSGLYKLAPLHLAHDCRRLGAADLAVLADGRYLAATELGIQGVVPFGVTDLILPLPEDLPAERVWVERDWLYASSGGRVFRRRLKIPAQGEQPVKPSAPEYGDDFWYGRSHLVP